MRGIPWRVVFKIKKFLNLNYKDFFNFSPKIWTEGRENDLPKIKTVDTEHEKSYICARLLTGWKVLGASLA